MNEKSTEYDKIVSIYSKTKDLSLIVNPNNKNHTDTYINTIYVLMRIYSAVHWRKIVGTKQHPSSLFTKKVKGAAVYSSIAEFIEYLTHSLGVEYINLEVRVIDALHSKNNIAMKILRRETQYLVQKCLELYFFLKKGE